MFHRKHERRRSRVANSHIPNQSPPTMFGQPYPTGDIFAVVDDRATGERAMQALKDSGLPDSDVDLLDGTGFAEQASAVERRRGLFARLGALLAQQEGAYIREYVHAADTGRYILIAHAPRPKIVERVHQVLRSYGAHQIRHYGRFTVAELL